MTRRLGYLAAAFAVALATLLVAMSTAGDAGFWRRYFAARIADDPSVRLQHYHPRATIAGGDGGAMPRALPDEHGLEPGAFAIADHAAEQQGASALLVSRNGHLVHTGYWQGADANTPVDGGEWAQAVLGLVTGAVIGDAAEALPALRAHLDAARPPVDWHNPWSAGAQRRFGRDVHPVFLERIAGRDYAALLSSLVWNPLNAGDAYVWLGDPAARSECCLVARLADWLRVAELLVNDGVFEGERVVPAGWVGRMLPLWGSSRAPGPEPFVDRGMLVLRGARGSRLWLLPSQRLAILLVSQRPPAGAHDETTLPNSIVRGIVNRTAGDNAAPDLHDLVPAH